MRYLVSYKYNGKDGTEGFGNAEIIIEYGFVDTQSLQLATNEILNLNPNFKELVILFFAKFEDPPKKRIWRKRRN